MIIWNTSTATNVSHDVLLFWSDETCQVRESCLLKKRRVFFFQFIFWNSKQSYILTAFLLDIFKFGHKKRKAISIIIMAYIVTGSDSSKSKRKSTAERPSSSLRIREWQRTKINRAPESAWTKLTNFRHAVLCCHVTLFSSSCSA